MLSLLSRTPMTIMTELPRSLHAWNIPPAEARQIQIQLASKLVLDSPLALDDIQTIAGVDVGAKGGLLRAAIVVLDVHSLQILEVATAQLPVSYPYIPGLLSFREGPVILQAIDALGTLPDVFLFDGQGIAHPRRLGIASHLGLWLNRPTIGCAKSWLVGSYRQPGPRKGDSTYLYDHSHTPIGVALRTRDNVKPVFVSPGHLCDIDSAVAITLATTTRYRLPEPIRAAHKHASLKL